jgi:LuxR family maltose regulon positive regulatory protein
VLIELGQLTAAADLLATSIDVCVSHGRLAEHAMLMVSSARLARARGKRKDALADLRAARDILVRECPGTPLLAHVEAAAASIFLDLGDQVRAQRSVARLPAGDDRTLLRARALLVAGSDPRGLLSRVEDSTARNEVASGLLQAGYGIRKHSVSAEERLLEAADAAWSTGQALALLDGSHELRAFADAVARRTHDDALGALLAATGPERSSSRPALSVTLSRGERELVPLLVGRETIEDIADILGVTRNTIKTRMQRLYRKLEVTSRKEAVLRAREQGWI